MTTAGPSVGVLAAEVARILDKPPFPAAVGLRMPEGWDAPEWVQVGTEEFAVHRCASPLEVRARLLEAERSGEVVVLLTSRSGQELGADVLARLARRRLFTLDPWEALRDRLKVRAIDPRLLPLGWLPERLLELAGKRELPVPPGGVLDADTAWEALLAPLGFSTGAPDLRELLAWTEHETLVHEFRSLPGPCLEAHVARLAETTGASGEAVLRIVRSGRGALAVAAGLLGEVLFGGEANGADLETARALGRLEAMLLGGATMSREAGRAWHRQAAERLARERGEEGGTPVEIVLERAESLAKEVGISTTPNLLRRSSWLPSAWDLRLADWVEAFERALEERSQRTLSALGGMSRALAGHRLAASRAAVMGAIQSMERLASWVASEPKAAESLAEAIESFRTESSFVDRERARLASAVLSPEILGLRQRLLERVTDRREHENACFAERLVSSMEGDAPPTGVVPVERVLYDVVAPLAAKAPVLVLLFDGMSLAIYRELAGDLARLGWTERRSSSNGQELVGLALLPTVTEVCRTSLLLGRPTTGTAALEKKGFTEQPKLRQLSAAAQPPILYHKGELAQRGGAGLEPSVRREVAKSTRRVVGVVLNVVDDQLPKGGQLLPDWRIETLRHVAELLEAAREVGRVVIVTADHGHIVERESELRSSGESAARYRTAPEAITPLGPGEQVFSGPRVLAPGGRIVAAWSERLRYSSLQAGYHGGASPQEVLVPLGVWAPAALELPDWHEAAPVAPPWFGEAPQTRQAPTVTSPAPKPLPPQRGLFEVELPVPVVPVDELEALFASPVYQEQRHLFERQALLDDQVAALLRALARRGGRATILALVSDLGLSSTRVRGLVTAVQRVLNVEGYPVLGFELASETVAFDRELMRRQFFAPEASR